MKKTEFYRQVAALHIASIDRGFLATLGVGFVSLMYRAIDEGRESVLLVEEREGRVVGFVSGGIGMRPIYRRMLRRPIQLGLSLLPSLLSYKIVLRIFETLRYASGRTNTEALPVAELLSIAVDPEFRGKAIADRLYRRLVEHFAAAGVPAFKITVGAALATAHSFYRRMGASPIATVEVHAGASSVVYVHRIV